MKIKKSTVEELMEKRKNFFATFPPYCTKKENDEAYDAIYDFAYKESHKLKADGSAIWDLLEVASEFDKLTAETVTALFEALGVEVCDE